MSHICTAVGGLPVLKERVALSSFLAVDALMHTVMWRGRTPDTYGKSSPGMLYPGPRS